MMRAVAGVGLVRLFSLFASFLVGVLLARLLGLTGYGWYSVAYSVVTIAGIPGELGLPMLVTREVATAKARNDPKLLFGVLRWANRTCLQVSLAMVLAITAGALTIRGSSPILSWAIICGVPTIPLLALAKVRGGTLQGLQYVVRGQVPANFLRPALLLIFLGAAYVAGLTITPPSTMLLYSATAAIVLATAALWAHQRLPNRETENLVNRGRQWLASTIPFALIDGMRMLQSEMTVLLLGFLAAPAEAGLFRIAIVTATVASLPLGVMLRATMPVIARLYANDERAKLEKLLRYSAYAQTAGVVLLSLPLLIFPEFLLSLAFGKEYAAAATALRIASAGQIANAAFGLNAEILNMTHREGRVTRAMAIGLFLNIVAVVLLIPSMGIAGAALGFTLSLLAWNVLTWLDSRRLLGLETSIFALARKT